MNVPSHALRISCELLDHLGTGWSTTLVEDGPLHGTLDFEGRVQVGLFFEVIPNGVFAFNQIGVPITPDRYGKAAVWAPLYKKPVLYVVEFVRPPSRVALLFPGPSLANYRVPVSSFFPIAEMHCKPS